LRNYWESFRACVDSAILISKDVRVTDSDLSRMVADRFQFYGQLNEILDGVLKWFHFYYPIIGLISLFSLAHHQNDTAVRINGSQFVTLNATQNEAIVPQLSAHIW
jgi:hypothetical protein